MLRDSCSGLSTWWIMPNGHGTRQIYFRSEDHDVLVFVDSLPPGERSRFIVSAIRLKRSMGEETASVAVLRRVVREELERWGGQLVASPPEPPSGGEDQAAVDKFFGGALSAFGD
jgi:hypothetical protein